MKEKIFVTRSSMPDYEEYCEAIRPLWDSHWLTNMGRYHKELEEQLKEYLDVSEVSLTVNGHMALELAIQSFGFPEGSEIITTPFTFISTIHAIVRNRLRPVFCDVKETDGTIDENIIESLITEKTVAILPVHVYGHICNVDKIQQIAYKYKLKVIYDSAHAFGEIYKGRGIAQYGDISIFSFHATKVFNTIEGGAVCSKKHEVYDQLYNLKNFGIRGEEYVTAVGANAKMNEFAAIMGLLNLNYIDRAIASRKRIYERYAIKISAIKGINLFEGQTIDRNNYAYLVIIVDDSSLHTRDDIYEELHKCNIFPRKYFCPLACDQECYSDDYGVDVNVPVARKIADRVLVLPLFENMSRECVDYICSIIE